MFKTTRALTLLSLILGCTACTNIMPTGYTHADMTPLSSPPPTEPRKDKLEYDDPKQIKQVQQWEPIASQAAAAITATRPPGNVPMMMKPAGKVTQNTLAFDHYLRQALLKGDHLLTTEAGPGIPVLVYDIRPANDQTEKLGNARVVLELFDGSAPVPDVAQVFLKRPKPVWMEQIPFTLPGMERTDGLHWVPAVTKNFTGDPEFTPAETPMKEYNQ